MVDISNVILTVIIVLLLAVTITLIAKTSKQDKGCNFDCENCPFPKCDTDEKYSIKKLQKADKE